MVHCTIQNAYADRYKCRRIYIKICGHLIVTHLHILFYKSQGELCVTFMFPPCVQCNIERIFLSCFQKPPKREFSGGQYIDISMHRESLEVGFGFCVAREWSVLCSMNAFAIGSIICHIYYNHPKKRVLVWNVFSTRLYCNLVNYQKTVSGWNRNVLYIISLIWSETITYQLRLGTNDFLQYLF